MPYLLVNWKYLCEYNELMGRLLVTSWRSPYTKKCIWPQHAFTIRLVDIDINNID